MLANEPARVTYGLKEVLRANENLAVQDLLIIDKLYRSSDYNERNKFVELIDSVKHSGGNVYKFSSLHISGEELNNYTGVAALLRFPVYEEEIEQDQEVSENLK
jgi:protein pelota